MQPNEIPLRTSLFVTDEASSSSIEEIYLDSQFTRFTELGNATVYIERGHHTADKRSQLVLSRNTPKRNGASRGVTRTMVKYTADVDVPSASDVTSTIRVPLILSLEASVPVGTDRADYLKALAVFAAILPRNEARAGDLDAPKNFGESFIESLNTIGEI